MKKCFDMWQVLIDKVAISLDKEALVFYHIIKNFQGPPHGQEHMMQGASVMN